MEKEGQRDSLYLSKSCLGWAQLLSSYCLSVYPYTQPLPAETVLVGRCVLLQESSELQQRVLLQQVHLRHGLAVDLQRCWAEAGPVRALEAVPPQPVPVQKIGDRTRTGHLNVSARHMQQLLKTYCWGPCPWQLLPSETSKSSPMQVLQTGMGPLSWPTAQCGSTPSTTPSCPIRYPLRALTPFFRSPFSIKAVGIKILH